jgi:hypothetical protein
MLIQQNIAQSFQSPTVRVLLGMIAIGLLYVFWKEVRKIPAKMFALMATAFVDMLGLLMIIPLLPFYVKTLGGAGINFLGMHFGIGIISGAIVASFTVAQLLSAPAWGRFSDRVGRRPTLLIALTASAIAYLIFGFAHSLFLLLISRIVQGAGVRGRFDRAAGSCAGTRLALGDDQPRRGARACARFFRSLDRQARPDAWAQNARNGLRGSGDYGGHAMPAQHSFRRSLPKRITRAE